MACSNCGATDHNVQRCPTVRRCGHCNRPGHDRRNCPKLHPTRIEPPAATPPTSPAPPRVVSPLSPQLFERLRELCRAPGLLVHLYWQENYRHFEHSRDAHLQGALWRLKATPHHGVGKTDRPTLNFLVANTEWLELYETAAGQREFHHGVLLRRTALEDLVDRHRYELADVEPKYPGPEVERDDYWQHDIGRQRFTALDAMAHCQVVRFATPTADKARYVDIPVRAVVTWW